MNKATTNSNHDRPNLFLFDNYRDYLRSHVEFLRVTQSESVRSLSLKAGFRSTNYLNLVIEGKRGLTTETASKVSRAFGLGTGEAEFFANLVLLNQAKTIQERKRYRERLVKSRAYRNFAPLKSKAVLYYSRWYYGAMRELVSLRDFKEDARWISKQLRGEISEQEALCALDDLIELGLLARDGDGRLVKTDKTIALNDSILSSALTDFQLNLIEYGNQASGVDVMNATLCLNPETAARVRVLAAAFFRELRLMSTDCQSGDRVVQVNLQLFPLTL